MTALAVLATVQRVRSPAVILLRPAERRVVPAFSLSLSSGGTWRSEEHRGHVVLVNLWATWCLPCRRELPVLSALATEDGPKGLDVIGVLEDGEDRQDRQDLQMKADGALQSFPVSYPVAVPEQMPQVASAGGVVPTTLLIDRDGRVAALLAGAFEESSLRSAVDQLLRER